MKIGELLLAVVSAIAVGVIIAKCAESHPKPRTTNTSERFRSIHGLPQTCTGTAGGDIMICPCNGICANNSEPCEPSRWYGELQNHVNGYIACPCSGMFADGELCQGSSFTPP